MNSSYQPSTAVQTNQRPVTVWKHQRRLLNRLAEMLLKFIQTLYWLSVWLELRFGNIEFLEKSQWLVANKPAHQSSLTMCLLNEWQDLLRRTSEVKSTSENFIYLERKAGTSWIEFNKWNEAMAWGEALLLVLSHSLNPPHFCLCWQEHNQFQGRWSSKPSLVRTLTWRLPVAVTSAVVCVRSPLGSVCTEAHCCSVKSFPLNQCRWKRFSQSNWTGFDSGFGPDEWKPCEREPAQPELWQ